MPICVWRDLGIGAPAIIINPRYGSMIPVFETYKGGVDFLGGRQHSKKNFTTPLGSKEARVGRRYLRKHAKRPRHAMYHGFDVFHAGLTRLCDVFVQGRDDHFRVSVVVVDQDKNEDGNA